MCGRYAASRAPEDLRSTFGIEPWDPVEELAAGSGEAARDERAPAVPPPDWNVAPTKEVPAVVERVPRDAGAGAVRQLRTLKWGLVPSWSKTPEGGARLINARAETVHEKASYRRAFGARRCILPADGYYEWVTGADERREEEKGRRKRPRKQPYFVTPADGFVMALAGLYEFWRDRTLPGDHPRAWWVTCTVITTEAETAPLGVAPKGGPRSLSDIHPRMPLMLTPDRWDAWLDPGRTDVDELRSLLAPPPPGLMRAYPVRTAVSDVRNNGPELVEELAAPEESTLF